MNLVLLVPVGRTKGLPARVSQRGRQGHRRATDECRERVDNSHMQTSWQGPSSRPGALG